MGCLNGRLAYSVSMLCPSIVSSHINLLRNEMALGAYSNTPPNSRIEERNTAREESDRAMRELDETLVMHPMIDALTLLWEDDKSLSTISDVSNFLKVEFDLTSAWQKSISTKLWSFCKGECGMTLAWYESSPEVFTIRLTLAGVACKTFGSDEIYLFLCFCREFLKARCTRIDINVTDRLNIIRLQDVIDSLESGNYCGFRDYEIRHSCRGKYKGTTVYLGNRNSQKFGRLYDKFAESRGAETGIRYEVEFKESLANEVFIAYTSTDNRMRMETLANVLVGAFRFVEKVNKNLNLCPTLKFWSEFTSRISRVHLSIKISRKPTTIATKLEWVRRNVAKSLGMLLDAIGWDRLNQILSSEVEFKRSQYTKFDDLAIKQYLLYPGAVFGQDDVFYNMV